MKTKALLILLSLTIFSCDKKEVKTTSQHPVLSEVKGESGISYNESLSIWNHLKADKGNSYIYKIGFFSWVGFGHTTEITVEKGIVTSRKYQEYEYDENNEMVITESYIEEKANLGSHEKGAQLLTIDQLYDSCSLNYLIVDGTKNKLYFETNTNGIMTTCGYVPNNCMDDCFQGIRIGSFEWLNK